MASPNLKRNAAVGCFVLPLGVVSGAMVAVLLSVVVSYFTKAQQCAELPSCNWYVYAGWGALIGGLSLPFLVVRQLLRRPSNPAARDEPATVPDANASL